MNNGIRSLPRYRHGGPHPEIPRGNYPSIGPMPSWAERIAAQIKSAPRRINRALQPETPGETAALVGASFAPGLGEAIDVADLIGGVHGRDPARMGFAAAGLLLPFVAGSTLRRIAGKGADAAKGSVPPQAVSSDLRKAQLLDDIPDASDLAKSDPGFEHWLYGDQPEQVGGLRYPHEGFKDGPFSPTDGIIEHHTSSGGAHDYFMYGKNKATPPESPTSYAANREAVDDAYYAYADPMGDWDEAVPQPDAYMGMDDSAPFYPDGYLASHSAELPYKATPPEGPMRGWPEDPPMVQTDEGSWVPVGDEDGPDWGAMAPDDYDEWGPGTSLTGEEYAELGKKIMSHEDSLEDILTNPGDEWGAVSSGLRPDPTSFSDVSVYDLNQNYVRNAPEDALLRLSEEIPGHELANVGRTYRRTGGLEGYPDLPMDDASVMQRLKDQDYMKLVHGNRQLRLEPPPGFEVPLGYDSDVFGFGIGSRELEGGFRPLDPGKAVFQSDNTSLAATYGDPVEIFSRGPKQLEFDARGAPWGAIPLNELRGGFDLDELAEFEKKLAFYDRPPAGKHAGYRNPRGRTIDTDNLNRILRSMDFSGFDAHNLRDATMSGGDQVTNELIQGATDEQMLFARLADKPSFVRTTLDPGLIRYQGARFDPIRLGEVNPLAGIAGLLGAGAARRNYIEREGRDE